MPTSSAASTFESDGAPASSPSVKAAAFSIGGDDDDDDDEELGALGRKGPSSARDGGSPRDEAREGKAAAPSGAGGRGDVPASCGASGDGIDVSEGNDVGGPVWWREDDDGAVGPMGGGPWDDGGPEAM